MRFLRTNTAVRLTVGPFLDKTDGVTPETGLTVTSCKLTFMVDDGNVPTLVLDTAPTASGGANDMVHVTGDDAGFYDLELAAGNVNYLGRAMLAITDAATHCPVFHEFMILPAMIYDAMVLGTDRFDTNVTHVADTSQTARDIGASVLLSSGTGTGQLSFTSGILKVDVDTIKTNPVVNAGTLTFPSGATLASTTNITAGTITTVTNLTNAPTSGDLTATMKTSVTTAATAATPTAAAVTGAVGSVTGNVGGNVTGSVGSIATGGISSASFAAGAITASAIAADAIGASELATDAVTEIAAAVWNSAMSSYQTAGTMGLAMNELDTIYTNAYDGITARMLANTTHISSSTPSSQIAAACTTSLTTALTEGYRGTGATGSVRDLLYEVIAHMGESSITSTTKTLKKIDGSTTAKTYTLNDATTPTSITETT